MPEGLRVGSLFSGIQSADSISASNEQDTASSGNATHSDRIPKDAVDDLLAAIDNHDSVMRVIEAAAANNEPRAIKIMKTLERRKA